MIAYFDRNSGCSGFGNSGGIRVIGDRTRYECMFVMDLFDKIGEVGSLAAKEGNDSFHKVQILSIKSMG
jgi:hypothetical protein